MGKCAPDFNRRGKEWFMVKEWVRIFWSLAILSSLFLGCASTSKEKHIKCPKCGAFFSTEEGVEIFKSSQPSEWRR